MKFICTNEIAHLWRPIKIWELCFLTPWKLLKLFCVCLAVLCVCVCNVLFSERRASPSTRLSAWRIARLVSDRRSSDEMGVLLETNCSDWLADCCWSDSESRRVRDDGVSILMSFGSSAVSPPVIPSSPLIGCHRLLVLLRLCLLFYLLHRNISCLIKMKVQRNYFMVQNL